ncbi:uncharacterized protein LOC128273077 [Anopheles cruzii]|uniref:uncharacterized protein LOC128273077 n=1 Tax=Anopheles cruzii TaxID=68878 RepID=UPI0022EC8BB1|nr:uncharacterized protein LOC128273077 [Anopheles cruzii]XP_052866962.1 uncharacterized protein LOC128273077 [Anopheles cruzii]XP_052866970.1 uncharacterized protein LOC128273077 [Anopheles cruzii]
MCTERSILYRFYNTLIFMYLIYVTRSFGVILEEYVVDQGRNLTLRCDSSHPVKWVREGRREDVRQLQMDGSLVLTNLSAQDSGQYTCAAAVTTLTTVAENEDSREDNTTRANISTSQAITQDELSRVESYASYENATGKEITQQEVENVVDRVKHQKEEIVKGNREASSHQMENFVELLKVNVKVRTPPLAVSNFYVRASTIIAVLVWEVLPNRTGGYAIRDFTAEMRRMHDTDDSRDIDEDIPELPWETIDPRHISPNARQLEIYHLIPNTTYEFRIWGNNQLGAGEVVTILATTQPRMEEKDLVRRIMIDAKNFDTRVWIAAVGIVMGTLFILSLGTCIVLYKECHEPAVADKEEELDSLELVPNIILNPGFCDSDDQGQQPLSPPMPHTPPRHHYSPQRYLVGGRGGEAGCHPLGCGSSTLSNGTIANRGTRPDACDADDDDEGEDEPMTFSRRMSIFFTGNTIKRI